MSAKCLCRLFRTVRKCHRVNVYKSIFHKNHPKCIKITTTVLAIISMISLIFPFYVFYRYKYYFPYESNMNLYASYALLASGVVVFLSGGILIFAVWKNYPKLSLIWIFAMLIEIVIYICLLGVIVSGFRRYSLGMVEDFSHKSANEGMSLKFLLEFLDDWDLIMLPPIGLLCICNLILILFVNSYRLGISSMDRENRAAQRRAARPPSRPPPPPPPPPPSFTLPPPPKNLIKGKENRGTVGQNSATQESQGREARLPNKQITEMENRGTAEQNSVTPVVTEKKSTPTKKSDNRHGK